MTSTGGDSESPAPELTPTNCNIFDPECEPGGGGGTKPTPTHPVPTVTPEPTDPAPSPSPTAPDCFRTLDDVPTETFSPTR